MNIFFTGSIRGGRDDQPTYEHIVRVLEKYGVVSSRQIADETLSTYGETNIPNKEILARELAALEKSDIVVAEVTTPSHGVGYMIARATALGKKVVALHRGDYALKLSGIIQGDPRVNLSVYESEAQIDSLLAAVLGGKT